MRVESCAAIEIELGGDLIAKIGIHDRLASSLLPFREVVPHGDLVILVQLEKYWMDNQSTKDYIAYDVRGFTVNFASRMKLIAKANTI